MSVKPFSSTLVKERGRANADDVSLYNRYYKHPSLLSLFICNERFEIKRKVSFER
jgi:hypothetical protein